MGDVRIKIDVRRGMPSADGGRSERHSEPTSASLQAQACHVSQYMPPICAETITEDVCGHIVTAQEAVGQPGQPTERSALNRVHARSRFIEEVTVPGRSGGHVQREAF